MSERRLLHLRHWPDPPMHGRLAFPANSRYVERVWVPVLGPAPTLLWRLLAELVSGETTSAVALEDVALGIGLGHGTGDRSRVDRALQRLARHRFITRDGEVWKVRTEIHELSDRHLRRLPAPALEAHDHECQQRSTGSDAAITRVEGRETHACDADGTPGRTR